MELKKVGSGCFIEYKMDVDKIKADFLFTEFTYSGVMNCIT